LRWADRALALLLFGCLLFAIFQIAFSRLEWHDWIAYALPSANLVERGTLSTPQLGSQADLDKVWLFNSPLMGLGPVPLYRVAHVGRVPYLAGVVLGGAAVLALVSWVIRQTISPSWALAVFCSQAVLGHRHYLAFFYNQRYDVFAVALVTLAFVPVLTRPGLVPAWRWLSAGLLPLAHPALAPAAALWLVAAAVRRVSRGAAEAAGRVARWLGPALLLLAGAGAAAWYVRPDGLRYQFLPYLHCMAGRKMASGGLPTWLSIAAGFPFGIASQATVAVVLLAAVYLLIFPRGRAPAPGGADGVSLRLPALAIALMVAFDLVRRFPYLDYYTLGIAPALLYLCDTPRRRRAALAVAVVLAGMNTAVNLRLDRAVLYHPQPLVDQDDAIAFVVEHTYPGDRVVLGPPLVLASAPRELPGGRRVVAVVPQVWCLDDFDVAAYRTALRGAADVYVGEATWYEFADSFDWLDDMMGRTPRNPREPLFEGAGRCEAPYGGKPLVIARNPTPGPQP
jgi:hypothetical protein